MSAPAGATAPVDPEIVAACERADRDAAEDFCRAAAPDVADACGVAAMRIGGSTACRATRIDVLAFNRVVGLGIERAATVDALDAIFEFFRDTPRFFVQLGPGARPPDLAERLVTRGMRHYNNWVKLWRSLSEPVRPTPLPGPRIEEIGPERARTYAELVCSVFKFPDALVPWAAAAVGRPGWHHYLAYDGKRPVGTGAMFVAGEAAWLGWAATLEDARGRGAQSELIVRRIADAETSGCRWAVVETAEDKPEKPNPSTRNLIRLGFQVAYLRPNYIWTREPAA